MSPLLFRQLRPPWPLNFRGQMTARQRCQLSLLLWRRQVFPYLEVQEVLVRQVVRSLIFDRPHRVYRKRCLTSQTRRLQREAPRSSMKAQKRRRGDWRGKSESGSYTVIRPPRGPPTREMRLRRRTERLLLLTRISKVVDKMFVRYVVMDVPGDVMQRSSCRFHFSVPPLLSPTSDHGTITSQACRCGYRFDVDWDDKFVV